MSAGDWYSDYELITGFCRLAEKLGRVPTEQDIEADALTPSMSTYFRRFGSWSATQAACGFDARPQGQPGHLRRVPVKGNGKIARRGTVVRKAKRSGHDGKARRVRVRARTRTRAGFRDGGWTMKSPS